MPPFPRKFLGLLLLLATVGVASWQTLAVSCTADAHAQDARAAPEQARR
jgi:hypothetical protein